MGILTLAALIAVVNPHIRNRIRTRFETNQRVMLTTTSGDLLHDGRKIEVIKYKGPEGISLEVLAGDKTGSKTIVDRIVLPDHHDGLFNFEGHVTGLAVADIDGDGRIELMAPTFDDQLVPHLNLFRYNPETKKFEPVQKSDLHVKPSDFQSP